MLQICSQSSNLFKFLAEVRSERLELLISRYLWEDSGECGQEVARTLEVINASVRTRFIEQAAFFG
ncbi:hypothetical protein BJ508DRAFT_414351 [Ascobolus immersus RN42]|uniref:Uncharacterized protein n=1 Tax=Ascobolus immersus RN42 TaxID=1160509 RepID=A0A3N4I9G8_ASCIM|nr:hypothetical protein BJ508DRAFT_414351 [Ascobolus immersus RN42]